MWLLGKRPGHKETLFLNFLETNLQLHQPISNILTPISHTICKSNIFIDGSPFFTTQRWNIKLWHCASSGVICWDEYRMQYSEPPNLTIYIKLLRWKKIGILRSSFMWAVAGDVRLMKAECAATQTDANLQMQIHFICILPGLAWASSWSGRYPWKQLQVTAEWQSRGTWRCWPNNCTAGPGRGWGNDWQIMTEGDTSSKTHTHSNKKHT